MTVEQLKHYATRHDYGIPVSACGDYKYIWAWNKRSGSMDYYIAQQVLKAMEDKAPTNAVYYDDKEDRWVVLEDCCEITQRRIKNYINN